jgi:hypothetical protein
MPDLLGMASSAEACNPDRRPSHTAILTRIGNGQVVEHKQLLGRSAFDHEVIIGASAHGYEVASTAECRRQWGPGVRALHFRSGSSLTGNVAAN